MSKCKYYKPYMDTLKLLGELYEYMKESEDRYYDKT